MANSVREHSPGVWVLDFPVKEDVVVEKSRPLVPPMVEASKSGPLVIVACIPADQRMVDPSVSAFWLEAMTTGGVKVNGLCVITKSLAVKTVVAGFAIAMKFREKPIHAKTFLTLAEGVAWAQTVTEPGAVAAPPVAQAAAPAPAAEAPPPRGTKARW